MEANLHKSLIRLSGVMRIFSGWLVIALITVVPAYAGKKIKVLFLGNSYTYYNNMPQHVANMATATGDTLIFDMYAPGGYTLDDHGQDTVSRGKIANGGWDYLVLQEQSQLPSFQSYQSNELYGMLTLFRKFNPCGRIMFYMTWGRQNGDASNCAVWPPVCTYLGMDSLIRMRYIQMAVNNKTELSPVGVAWRHIRHNSSSLNLYDIDGSHPSAAGSYLAACCFYTSLFKKNPNSLTYNATIGTANANTIKQAVKTVVFDSLSSWDYSATLPGADFRYTIGTGHNQVHFLNQSSLADYYLWDFGDNTTSTAEHPVHNYATDGIYTVKLTSYNCDVDTTYINTKQVMIRFCPFTPTIVPGSTTLCPGTNDTLWTQAYSAYQWYDVNDAALPGATGQYLDVNSDNRYYVEATLNGCTERSVQAYVATATSFSTWYIIPSGELIGEDSACAGDTIALTIMFNKPPVADDSLMDWSFNGQPIAGHHNDTLFITQQGVYEARVRHGVCPSLDKTRQINFTFVNCTSDISGPISSQFAIYPNPVGNLLSISSDAFLSGNCQINITDAMGRTVHQQRSVPANRQSINMSTLSGGLYFVLITDEGNLLYKGKVLKQ